MHPAFVAAALGDGRDTGILLQGCGVGKALASFTEGNEEPRSESRPGAGQRSEELVVGQRRCKLGDRGVEALDSDRYSAQLWEQRLDEQAQRVGHRGVGVQRALGTNRFDAALDSLNEAAQRAHGCALRLEALEPQQDLEGELGIGWVPVGVTGSRRSKLSPRAILRCGLLNAGVPQLWRNFSVFPLLMYFQSRMTSGRSFWAPRMRRPALCHSRRQRRSRG